MHPLTDERSALLCRILTISTNLHQLAPGNSINGVNIFGRDKDESAFGGRVGTGKDSAAEGLGIGGVGEHSGKFRRANLVGEGAQFVVAGFDGVRGYIRLLSAVLRRLDEVT